MMVMTINNAWVEKYVNKSYYVVGRESNIDQWWASDTNQMRSKHFIMAGNSKG